LNLELRPLSIGDILDRTFTLYRSNFLLFIALAGIPRLPALASGLLQIQGTVGRVPTFSAYMLGLLGLTYLLSFVGYLFSQGGAVVAVSELYLGRSITIMQSFRRVVDEIGPLLGVLILNGLIIVVGLILLIIPGIYMMCRLFVGVPAAVIERKGPMESLSRSMELTKGFAGRVCIIILLYFVVSFGFGLIMSLPLGVVIATGARDPSVVQTWSSVQVVLSTILEVLLSPILLIATSIYYYDLRVRKEGFDLQVMMDPDGANIPRANFRSIVPEGQ